MDTKSHAHRVNEGTSSSMTGSDKPDAGVDLRAWLGTIRRRKLLIALITVLGTILAYFVIEGMTPLYTSTTKVLIESQQQNVVEFEAVMEGITLDASAIGSQVEVLQSRSLASRVVDELGLLHDPEFNSSLVNEEPSLLSQLDPRPFLRSIGVLPGEPEAAVLTPEQLAALEREKVIDAFLDRVLVETLPFTYVLEISFTSESADKAALVANTVAELYIVDQLEAKFQATRQANDWLRNRLEDLRKDVVAADDAVANYQSEFSLGGEDRQSLIEQQLNEANAQLMAARADRAEAQARLQQMRNLVARSGPASVGAVLESSMIQGLQTQLAEAKRDLAELSTRYGELHPEIINTNAKIADLERTIDEEVQKVLQNLENDVEIAQAREASVRQSVENLKGEFNVEQSAGVGLLELMREAEAARQLYDTMLARYKEVSEQEDIQKPDARVISVATVSGGPSWPQKKLFFAGSFLFSFIISIVVVIIIEMMSAGFRTIEDAERVLGQRALGEVPMMSGLFRSDPEKSIVADPNSSFAEAVRGLSTALMLTDVDQPPKLIAVASSLSEEGKTSIAIALARLMAMGTRTVLLIDGDLRKPRIHRELGLSRSPGLSDVIANDLPLLDAVNVEESTGLHFLSAGTDMPNPQDLLHSKRAKATFDLLREAYDTVIVDTPAIMPVSDGLLLTHLADATVFLVRWESTPRNVAARALKKIQASGAVISGVVLSRVNRRKQASYGGRTDAYYYGRY